jgi:hypothetical protein
MESGPHHDDVGRERAGPKSGVGAARRRALAIIALAAERLGDAHLPEKAKHPVHRDICPDHGRAREPAA